jgi:hypothetical protein
MEELKEVIEYFERLDKLLENKDIKGLIELAKEDGYDNEHSDDAYTIAMHKLIVGRSIGSKENQEESYKWLEENGFNPESHKFKLYSPPRNPWYPYYNIY